MNSRMLLALAATLGLTTFVSPDAHATKLLRYPNIHGDQLVFTHGGDLWTASVTGGVARRITAHPGLELFAKYSPDGKWLAFTGQYDGDEHVYIMPSDGGSPTRLTYYPAGAPLPARWGFEHQVYGWTPDGKNVLFKSTRDNWQTGRLYTVAVAGGLPSVLSPPTAGAGTFSPDGQKLFYSPLSRDFRTWKRYQGGWAQDLYVYDLKAQSIQQITHHKRTDRDPMWIRDKLYFASDRDGKLNLYVYDLKDQQTTQLTHHTTADVRWPSSDGQGRIVYELEGELHIYNVETQEDKTLSINVPSDQSQARPRYVAVKKNIESAELSPNGKRVAFVARGDVFSVPAEKGLTRNLTHSSNAHDREAQWSPDGQSIVYISDQTGEEQLWLANLKKGSSKALTTTHTARLYKPRWSPDGRHIAYGDKDGQIYSLELKSGDIHKITDDPGFSLQDWVWSPRGGFLAFTQGESNGLRSIYIYSIKNKKLTRITNETFNEFSPTWSPDGNFLYFVGNRNFAAQFGTFDFNYIGVKSNIILGLTLQKTAKSPFIPKDDPGYTSSPNATKDDKKAKKKTSKKEIKNWSAKAVREAGYITIDFDGLSQRVFRTPIPPGDNYRHLEVTKESIYYVDQGRSLLGSSPNTLMRFDFKTEKTSSEVSNIGGYTLSWDHKKLLVNSNKKYQVLEAGKKEGKDVALSGLRTYVDPKQEWATIFNEVWRRYRDYFYVENMHGQNWVAIRDRYRKQLSDIAHREELNDLMGQMIAELNVSHAYVSGGDLGLPVRHSVALPGARFELDAKADRYRIAKIFEGQNEESKYRCPLTEAGINASVGNYIIAINGQDLRSDTNPYALLTLPAKSPVELTLSKQSNGSKSWTTIYSPISSEYNLVYLEHILDMRRRVAKATNGKVGYLHIPDMGANGLSEFTKWFYSQLRKEGLIIDVRSNGGGFVSQTIIDRLAREILGTGFSRTVKYPSTYPRTAPIGAMVTLISEDSASDGDIFPWAFREAGLGPLIGKRTWGGVIGITGHGPLIDGGEVFVPEFSMNDRKGEYIIEGEGISPDIEVWNNPVEQAKGRDQQLERGIKEVLKLISKKSPIPAQPAPAPVR